MKALVSLAFGAVALVSATFATAAPAAASDVGVYAGSNGFAIQVNDYGRYGYNRYGYNHRRGCWDYWYRRNHPYRCGYRYRESYYPYYRGYYDRDRCYSRWYRERHPYRCRYYYRRHDYRRYDW